MNRESLRGRERMESLKCWRLTTERDIKLVRPSGPIAQARAGGGRRDENKSPPSCAFTCPTEYSCVEVTDAELVSAPTTPTASSKC
jgi:hypothetical protein